MAESSIPVDLLNPGQVFACIGFVEAADILLGNAAGVFDWQSDTTKFRVSAAGAEDPVTRVLRFLEEANVVTQAPAQSTNSPNWLKSWGEAPVSLAAGSPFPYPDPSSPATLPAVLRDPHGTEIAIDYWGDATRRDNVKFWAGSRGYPGATLLSDAVALVRGKTEQHSGDPFALSCEQSSSFRFDWRSDYIPNDMGYSFNRHKSVFSKTGYPVVEILAAIGVTNARPKRADKLEYRYGVMGGEAPLDPTFLRAALGARISPVAGVPFRRFVMRLGWPGKEGQARCITQVTEENNSE